MKILDSQGRLFGKISILDLGAILVILLVLIGVLFFPGTSTTSVAQIGNVTTKPVQVDVIVLGLKGRNPKDWLKSGEKTNLIIRNQPYGQVNINSVDILPRTVLVPQPDGSVKALPDPRTEEIFSTNILLQLEGRGSITKDGPVLGNIKVKIGSTVELEGMNYDFNATVLDVKVKS